MLQVHASLAHLYLNFSELAVPLFIRRVISKQVISTGIANAQLDGASKIVVAEELASGVERDMLQSLLLVESLIGLGLERSVQLRTRNDTFGSFVGDVAQLTGDQPTGIDGIDCHMSVAQQVRGFAHLLNVVARSIEIYGIKS